MKVKFFGTRGSIPVTGAEYQKFGGNTTCIQITFGDNNQIAIFDAGTGIRELGKQLIKDGVTQKEFVILFSHFHWDHIQGLPFFPQAYMPGNKINMLAMGKGSSISNLKEIFTTQLQVQYFPVQLENMGADFHFCVVENVTEVFNVTKVTANRHTHPGGAFSYRIENNGRVLVICTDVEHPGKIDKRIVELAKDADLLIHEAQFTTEELKTKKGWGHSSFDQAIEVAKLANVKKLAITHHDPDHDDDFLSEMELYCKSIFPNSFLAREKLEIVF